jgi:hypothetical protein
MGRKKPRRPEIFLSHASSDIDFVDRVVALLRDHGFPVWYSRTDLLGAHDWHDEIGKALARCPWFVVVLSPAATESIWVKREAIYALRQQRLDGYIVPVLYQSCEVEKVSWLLPGLQMVDFREDFHAGCRALLRVWGIEYAAPE